MKRSHKSPIVEIYNRVQEKLNCCFYKTEPAQDSINWSRAHFKSETIDLSIKNNNCFFVSKNNEVFRILYFFSRANIIHAHCFKIKKKEPLFTTPFNSKFLNLYKSGEEYEIEDINIIQMYHRKVFHYYDIDINTNYYISMCH